MTWYILLFIVQLYCYYLTNTLLTLLQLNVHQFQPSTSQFNHLLLNKNTMFICQNELRNFRKSSANIGRLMNNWAQNSSGANPSSLSRFFSSFAKYQFVDNKHDMRIHFVSRKIRIKSSNIVRRRVVYCWDLGSADRLYAMLWLNVIEACNWTTS